MSITFDEGTAKKLEALYQSQDAKNRRRAVLDALQLQPGERVLDIGTGLGHLALEMAGDTGPQGAIVGIDLNEPMLAFARKRCAETPWIAFLPGDAAQLPFEDDSFDAAVSVQVYEYIADTPQVLREMHRVLKPGGRGVIIATDWKSTLWHSADPDRMNNVLSAWEEHCVYSDLPRVLGQHSKQAGFTIQSQRVVLQFNPTLDADAYSYHIIDFIKSFTSGRRGVSEEEAEAWARELLQLAERGAYFFCLNQFLFLVTK